MSCAQCEGIEREFDTKTARKDLRKYHRRGPRKATRWLIDTIRQEAPDGKTLLDIGGGVGVIPFELLKAGLKSAVSVDASTSYLQIAREEAVRRDLSHRVDYVHGDFIDVAPRIEPADIVTLDRVICCYPDMDALVGNSASKAREYYALIFPRDDVWMRTMRAGINLFMRIRRSPMRFFLHPSQRVDGAVRRHGFDLQMRRMTPMWQLAFYRRVSKAGAADTSA